MVVFIAQGTIARQPGSGRRTIITDEIRKIVEEQMCRDNSHVLTLAWGYSLNLRTILHCRGGRLGGVPTASSYRM